MSQRVEARAVLTAAIKASIEAHRRLLDNDLLEAILQAARMIEESLRHDGKLLVFGNGGSAADAQHIAAEFVGRFLLERRALPALALSTDTSALTAIANDYGFEQVFARQIEALGRAGDIALGITTSGSSANVVEGLRAAQRQNLRTIALTGGLGGLVTTVADVCISVPSTETPRVQETHLIVAHAICEVIESALAPELVTG